MATNPALSHSQTDSELYWSELSDLVVPDSFKFDGSDEKYDTILAEEVSAPQPFDLEDDRFKNALAATLGDVRFLDIRTGDPYSNKGFYRRQEAHIRPFWQAVRDKYLSAVS